MQGKQLGVTLVLATLLLSGSVLAVAPPSIMESMLGALELSPDHYVSALIEYGSESQCEETEAGTACFNSVRSVETYASATPSGDSFPREFKLFVGSSPENAKAGSRALVIAIPMPGIDGFAGKRMHGSPNQSDTSAWAQATIDAVGQRRDQQRLSNGITFVGQSSVRDSVASSWAMP
jgi:hypothetical protein